MKLVFLRPANAIVALVPFLLAWPAAAEPPAADAIRLATVPEHVYKVRDAVRAETESWYFNVVVDDELGRNGLRPLSLEIELFAGAEARERRFLTGPALATMRRTSYRVMPQTHRLSLRRLDPLDEIFDLRLEFPARPIAWSVDRVRIALELEVPGEGRARRTVDVPLHAYAQRTELLFPLRGPAIVTQGTIRNGGHAGHSNQFAVDVMGLDAGYGPMADAGESNAAFAGWGREILAPAAGTVAYARNDVPDTPPESDPLATYGSLPEPILATAGNCVIIDHGNGEWSVLMHMRQGSVTVRPGDSVESGQAIGRMGSSGDAFGVHLHYQLQDGPALFRANSLPVRFRNLEGIDLVRGAYFAAE